MVIEELGTTFIKFGQWLSVRPDFIPPEVMQEFELLQDRLAPVPFEQVRRCIESETGKPIDELFEHIDPFPLATASIAQVHRAVLRSGEVVAVKVQHAGLENLIAVDFSILSSIMQWAVRNWPHLALHRPDEMLSSFKSTLADELDFLVEAKNQSRIAEMFGDTPWIRIPKIYWEHSTSRLLVMEYLQGFKISQTGLIADSNLDSKLLAERLSDCFFHQIFEEGMFHADPHPANILVMSDNQVGLIDFGIVSKFDQQLLDRFLDWFYAVVYRDVELFSRTFLRVGTPVGTINQIQFRNDCRDYIDELHFQPASRISFARVMKATNKILYKNKIAAPPTFLFFFKAVSTLEGVVRRLDPAFDWRDEWGPRFEGIIRRRYSLQGLQKQTWNLVRDYGQLIQSTPEDLRDVLRTLKAGKVVLDLKGFDEYRQTVADGFRGIAKSVVAGFIILGICVLGHSAGVGSLQGLASVFSGPAWIPVFFALCILFLWRMR
jgi:ubiquinone biosynthesis protein